jgi:hypothetical protein
MSMRAASRAIAALLALGFGIGCGEPAPIPEPPPGPERLARRFLPFDARWIREADIPHRPQVEPAMAIWELSESDPEAPPTPEQRGAAEALVAHCRESAERKGWFEFQRGLADGYRLMVGDRRHYVNEAFLFDDAVLDCERPEYLMYYGTPQGKLLAGVMFYAAGLDQRGPQIGGPLTLWHYHIWFRPKCLRGGLLLTGEGRKGCRDGEPSHRSPEMLHVWFLEHPDGPFATTMWLDREVLEAAIRARGAEAAP